MKGLRAAVFVGVAVIGGCASAPEPDTTAGGPPSFYRSMASAQARIDADAARDMISQYRRNHGLGPVTVDPTLERAALDQAKAMAQANALSHEVRGSLDKRLQAAGIPAGYAVENVSAGYHTLAEAFSGWRDSPPHKENLLAKNMHRMGIATAYAPGTRYKVFWALVMTD